MGLLPFLQHEKTSRKVFGKRELKIIEKQLLGINLTQSEKNRLSRDIRAKLSFIREVNKYAGMFRLKKGSLIDDVIKSSIEEILADQCADDIEEIILFGSTVTGERTLRSDIDLAVRFKKISLEDATLFRKRIMGRVSRLVDVEVYNILPVKIKADIDKEKKIVYLRR